MFVTKGDLLDNKPVTANWLGEYFHQVNQQHIVATVNTLQTVFAANPLQLAIGLYGQNDQGTHLLP